MPTIEGSPTGGQPAAAPSGVPANPPPGQQGAPAPQPNAAPQELVIKGDRGQDIRLPIDRAADLVKAGLRVEQRMAEVNQRGRHVQDFDRFMEERARNPVLDEAVKFAIANPGLVVQQARGAPPPIQPGAPPQGELDGEGQPATPAAANPEVAKLHAQIGELTEAVRGMLGKESMREVETALAREIDKHPWVKGNQQATQLVRNHVESTIQLAVATKQPVPSVAQLVFEAASQAKELIQESDQRRLAEAEERKRLRTTDPMRAASALTPPPKLTAKSFGDGTLAAAVKQRLQDFLG